MIDASGQSFPHQLSRLKTTYLSVLIGLLLALAIVAPTMAQTEGATLEATRGVGVAFAPIGGHGFSYRYMPLTGFGFQAGTVFWKSGSDSYFNVGAEVMYILKRTRLTAFYIPAGLAVTYLSQMNWDPNQNNREYRDTSTHISGGAGLGFTAHSASWEDIWFSLDLVMVADQADIMPFPQFAIHYFFR